jgi:hypothetical protein
VHVRVLSGARRGAGARERLAHVGHSGRHGGVGLAQSGCVARSVSGRTNSWN